MRLTVKKALESYTFLKYYDFKPILNGIFINSF